MILNLMLTIIVVMCLWVIIVLTTTLLSKFPSWWDLGLISLIFTVLTWIFSIQFKNKLYKCDGCSKWYFTKNMLKCKLAKKYGYLCEKCQIAAEIKIAEDNLKIAKKQLTDTQTKFQ